MRREQRTGLDMNPDLILINANVVTLDWASPRAEVVVISNGKVAGIASNSRIKPRSSRKLRIIDCRGKTILPGFIDAHCHLHSLAESMVITNLGPDTNIRSITDMQSRIREVSQNVPAGSWIRCGGYNEFYLTENRHPNRLDLDFATSIHPIKLTHRTGHAHVLNSLALKLVGISKESPDPEGGLIERDLVTGEPTGLLYGMGDFLSKRVPPIAKRQLQKGIKEANKGLLSQGITSIQDASYRNDFQRWHIFHQWKAQGHFIPRISMMIGPNAFESEYGRSGTLPFQDGEHISIQGVKVILDQTTGRVYPSQDTLNNLVTEITASGLQAAIHAIEEESVEVACNAIAYALKKYPRSNHRHRLEHCSVCPPRLSKRLAALGVMVVTQPSFIYYNGERYLQTVPSSQLRHLYPIRSFLRNGVCVAGSSDCPIVKPNPLIGVYSAVCRRTETGAQFPTKEGITPLEALKLFTISAAKAAFQEKVKGSIKPGKFADLVVLNADPTKVPVEEIKDIRVEMTILDGEIIWEKGY
jgi:predicted amidohydrolase YtcJ